MAVDMSFSYYVKVVVSLLILCVILYCVLKFARAYQGKRFSQDIKIIDRLPVDAGVTLMVVSVKEKRYLFGVGGKDIKLLKEL